MPLYAGLCIADEAVHPGIDHFHFKEIPAGTQLAGEFGLVRCFPEEGHVFPVHIDVGHLAHFTQIDGQTRGDIFPGEFE